MDVEIMNVLTQMLWVATKIVTPILLVTLGIGLVVGLLQAVVQVQEATLTFVPKLVGVAVVLAVSGGWMMNELTEHFRELMSIAPELIRL